MQFRIQKCGILVLKRRKLIKRQKIRLDDGVVIRKIGKKRCNYLGFIEAEQIQKKKMKETFQKEYLGRAILFSVDTKCPQQDKSYQCLGYFFNKV